MEVKNEGYLSKVQEDGRKKNLDTKRNGYWWKNKEEEEKKKTLECKEEYGRWLSKRRIKYRRHRDKHM